MQSGSLDVSVAGVDGQGHTEAGGPHGGSGGGDARGSIYLETSSQTFRDQQFDRLNVDGGSVGTHSSSGNGAPGGLGRKVARVFGSTANCECLNLDDNACAEPTDREQFCHGLNDETLGFQIVKFEFDRWEFPKGVGTQISHVAGEVLISDRWRFPLMLML